MSKKQSYGVATATYLVVANIVGTGILSTTGWLTMHIPDHRINLLLWVFGGLVSLCGAACLAEIASAYPTAGGDFVFVRKAFGRRMGFSFGLTMSTVGFAAPLALMAYTFGAFFAPLINDAGSYVGFTGDLTVMTVVLAITSITVLTWLHTKGYDESEKTQAATTLGKILVLLLLVVIMLMHPESAYLTHLNTPGIRLESTSYAAALATNLTLILYAYTGWNAAAYLAGEIKDPRKSLKIALVGGTLLVTALYAVINLGYAAIFSPAEIQALTNEQRNAFANTILQKILSPQGAQIGAIVLGLGMIASISAVIVSGSRLVYAMAIDGLLPKKLVQTCTKSGLPKFSLWAQSLVAIAFLLTGSFEALLNYAGFGLVAVSVFVVLPIFKLRNRPDYRPTFRTGFYPVLPVIFVVSCVLIFVVGATEQPMAAGFGLATVVISYLLCPNAKAQDATAMTTAEQTGS